MHYIKQHIQQGKRFAGIIATCFLLLQNLYGRQILVNPALIPTPQKISWNNQPFELEGNQNRKVFRIVSKLPEVPINHDEAYILKINSDSLVLLALTEQGIFRGQQTVNQLTYTQNGKLLVAGCQITDWPAFKIRGFMQDVGRNYMSLPMLKEQIDVMAAYKFNVFHFHVTDNQGWRLESKKYPQLSSSASMSRWQGKFYTRNEFLELASYCNERHITLIPELDIPGHCEAFRKAFALDSMSDPRVQPIILDLIDELCALAPKDKMPYIHLGTDEVWHKHEHPAPGLLAAAIERVENHHRTAIVWRPGQQIDTDKTSITQLWSAKGAPKEGHAYIDSRLNYLNHLDPFSGVVQLYFDRICNASHGDSLRLGGILCCWNDNNVNDEYDILKHNPVYPGMLTYSETSWHGQTTDFANKYLARLPWPNDALFAEFQEFEGRLIAHRDRYFQGKPFQYVKQTEIEWNIFGPFDNENLGNKPETYTKVLKNKPIANKIRGGTIHLKHFFGYPSLFTESKGTVFATTKIWSPKNQSVDCWIGFHDWSRSGGRRGGPFPQQGEWHTNKPEAWVNRKLIAPPTWNNPGLTEKTEEIPFSDENCYFRKPATIVLKKGWNEVLLKVPNDGKIWKWMFTFVPIKTEGTNVSEAEGLKFKTE